MVAKEDLLTPVHKGLRSMIYGLSARLQTNDFADLTATRALVTDIENNFDIARSAGCILCMLASHAADEEGVVFPAAAKVERQLISELVAEHHDLTRRELEIAKSGHAILEMTSVERRLETGKHLNVVANQLFAAYITHMNREETDLVPRMKEHFTDPEMLAMRGKIIGQMPPDRLFSLLGWILPSLNVTELSDFMVSLKAGAPPPVVKAVTDLGAARVDPARWDAVKLRVAL